MPKTLSGAQGVISLGLELNPTPPRSFPAVAPKLLTAEVAERIRLLLRGLAIHLPNSELADSGVFQKELNAAADLLREDSTADDLDVVIAQTLKAAKEFEARISQVTTDDSSALRRMVQSVMETIKFILGSNDAGVKRLTFIENRLASVTNPELKPLLEQCIFLLRQECHRLQTQTQERITALEAEVQVLIKSLNVSRATNGTDPVTGLPSRAAAEQAIQEAIRTGRGFLTALFVVRELTSVNGRYGRETGDDILLLVARSLAGGLPEVRLCRWSGPAFLAVFAPKADRLVAEKRVTDLTEQKWEKTVQTEQGEQSITVTCSARMQWFSAEVSCEAMFRKFDAFLVGP